MAPTQPVSDEQLIRYLLGTLPSDEAERLDERTIADDELVERLGIVEDDLVDAYAAGRLSGERRQRFESFYLASPRRRRKAAFGRNLRGALERVTEPSAGVGNARSSAPRHAGRAFWWELAAAAALILGLGLAIAQNASLRRELRDSERQFASADERAAAASQQLEVERKSAAAAKQALADARTLQPLATVALVLRPQTRGIMSVPTIAIRPGASIVLLDLALERAGGASYDVALRDPATNLEIWRSPPLAPQRARQTPVVAVSVPAGLLKAQHYTLDVFALHAGSAPEFVNSYAFEVVRR